MTELKREKQPSRSLKTAAHMLGFGLLLALAILQAKGPPVDRGTGGFHRRRLRSVRGI